MDEQPQEIHSGSYWRVKKADGELKEGWVLLLQSIRKVDNEPHTMIVRGHPSQCKNGDTEYRFLIDDFLANFSFVPEAEARAIRQQELREVQGKVNEIQNRIALAASNPDLMKEHVDKGVKEWEKKEKLGRTDKLQAPTSASEALAIASSLTTKKVDEMTTALARQGKVAELQAEWIQKNTEALAKTVESMTPYITEQAAAALARTEDIMVKVKKITRGVESLYLYVGRDVDVETIQKGESAASDISLSVKQSKLYMNEELAAWADIGEEFDFNNQELFFKALKENQSLVDQIFPTERCILCMAVRRFDKEYSDNTIVNAIMNQRNKRVFLLVRDGKNLYKVWSPVESHLKSDRLFPTQKEIDDIFKDHGWWNSKTHDYEYKTINYLNTSYTDKLEVHEQVALHYKRFLIMLAGLDHRLNLFGTFYTEPKSLNFISPGFLSKYFNMIADDEQIELQLTGETKASWAAWLGSRNEYLRSGSRVVGLWANCMSSETAPGAVKPAHWSSRSSKDRVFYDPTEDWSVKVAYREGKDIFVKVPVSGETQEYNKRSFEAAVNLSKYRRDYGFGFLVLDAVKAEDLEYYIFSRIERRNFTNYIRLFKFAAKFLRDEEARQKEARQALIQALADGRIAEGEKATQIVDTAIMTYRAAARGAEIPKVSEPDYKKLLNQMFQLANGDVRIEQAVALAHKKNLIPLRLVVSGKSVMRLYCAPKLEEQNDILFRHAQVHCITLYQQKSGLGVSSIGWKNLTDKDASETVLYEWSGAAEWKDRPSPVSHTEKMALLKLAQESKIPEYFTRKLTSEEFDQFFKVWIDYRNMLNARSSHVVNPGLVIPIGLYLKEYKYEKRRPSLKVLGIAINDAASLLYLNAPEQSSKNAVMIEYVSKYLHKDAGREKLQKDKKLQFHLCEISPDALKDSQGFHLANIGSRWQPFKDLNKALKELVEDDWREKGKVYIASSWENWKAS